MEDSAQPTDEILEELEAKIRKLQRSPEEVAALGAGKPLFEDWYAEWERAVEPASPEELAAWEEILQDRHPQPSVKGSCSRLPVAETTLEKRLKELEAHLRSLQRSPEEVAAMGDGKPVFSEWYPEWERTVPPATPEELADWEEFLREREEERQAEIALEEARWARVNPPV